MGKGTKQWVAEVLATVGVEVGGAHPWDIQVHNDAFYDCILDSPSLRLGESYMAGWWDCEDLEGFIFRLLRGQVYHRVKPDLSAVVSLWVSRVLNRQNKLRSLDVIYKHYQLGNDLFEAMLGKMMAYSCGYWKQADNLDDAQRAKFDLIAQKLYLKPGMRVLDIGCGWGTFAAHIASHYGVEVVGVTLSKNQAEYARKVCAGLAVKIEMLDYRELTGHFDRVVEIGMFEHVGPKNYRLFMDIVQKVLPQEGLFMLHTIGSNVTSPLAADPWLDKYIFPNGHLPSVVQVGEAIEGKLILEDWHSFGPDYEKTLLAWFERFHSLWPALSVQYPEVFYRMWKYYLLSCAAAFKARSIQLWQVVLSKGGVLGGYTSIR